VLASPAFTVRLDDVIELDGAEIPAIERTRLFLFHKPAGVVTTTRDPEGRRTVFDILPKDLPRLMTVGRLDINTEGLLLLTNDGGLSRVLELPSTGWLRRYRVRVHGKVDTAALEGLSQGIAVDGVFYGAIEASLDREQGSNAWLTLGLREGKNREVKNVLGALGLEVSRLIRISYGPFQLGELPEGAVQELKGRTLRDQLGQRLVEESGANFSAPIATPFSNRPVRREREAPAAAAERPKIRRDGERGRIGEGGLIKNRKREREQKREDALGRLQTSRPEKPRGFKQEGKPGGRDKKRDEPRRSRSSNVWMAPGARPGGKKTDDQGVQTRAKAPSSGASRHLLPDGEKRQGATSRASSPRRGEGGRAERSERTKPGDRPSSPASPSRRPRGEGKGPRKGSRKP
jgi:23S rRNA pseudouridine2605 synthase